MPSTPRPSISAGPSAGRRSAPTSTAAGPGTTGRPGAAPALELELSTDVVLRMVDSRVVPSLVMVVTTGPVVVPDVLDVEDMDSVCVELELVVVAVVPEWVVDPVVVVVTVLPSLVTVETTEEKMPRAESVVPVAVAWAGCEGENVSCVCVYLVLFEFGLGQMEIERGGRGRGGGISC